MPERTSPFWFRAAASDPRTTARSRIARVSHMVFVHPTQFLVTAPDGTVARDENVGGLAKHVMNDTVNTYAVLRGMLITTEQIGTNLDKNCAVYFDLPLPHKK